MHVPRGSFAALRRLRMTAPPASYFVPALAFFSLTIVSTSCSSFFASYRMPSFIT